MLQSKRRIKKPNNPVTAIGVGLICCGLWLGVGVAAAADPDPLRPSGSVPALAAKVKTAKTPEQAKDVKAKTAKAPEQAKDAETPLIQFRYSPTGKADPFRPFLERDEIAREKAIKSKPKAIPLLPLQRAGIEQFRLVGIAVSASCRVAVVEDAAGKSYTVKPGTVIGQNGGRVAEIQEDRVIVEQAVSDQKKQTKINRVVIQLRKDEYEGRL